MKLLRKLTAFILAFSLLAGTVVVMSAAVGSDGASASLENEAIAPAIPPEYESLSGRADLAATAALNYTPRLTAPAKTNKYYYSDANVFYRYGWGMPNCTCYAWGRAYEILGRAPSLSTYSAYLWYDYNKDNRIYTYGTQPKLGAIACWVYSSGTSGHVAVVEKIENNTITFSNSAYSGAEFYLSTAPVNDPSNGNKTWIFQGYIYFGDFVPAAAASEDEPSLTVGTTVQTGDVYRITSEDGVNLRSNYGTSSRVLGGIMYGQDVTVTKYKNYEGYKWGYTTYNGVSGWFVTDFAKLIYRKNDTVSGANTVVTQPDAQPATAAPTVKPATAPATQPATAAPTVKPTTAPVTQPAIAAPTEAPTAPPTVKPTLTPVVVDRVLLMGDLDNDGEVTVMDATRIQRVLAELIVPTEYMLTVGDYDGDSVLSIMDASSIRHHLAFDC